MLVIGAFGHVTWWRWRIIVSGISASTYRLSLFRAESVSLSMCSLYHVPLFTLCT